MKKQVIKDTLALLVITIVSALCLSLVYSLTSAKIADAEAKEKTDSFYAVSEKAASFDKIDASVIDGFNKENSGAAVLEAYEAKDGEGAVCGVVASVVSHNGYGGDIVLSVGVDQNGVITGVRVTDMSETSGLGANCQNDEWTAQFKGKSAGVIGYVKNGQTGDDKIDAITGATITTKAVLEAVNTGAAFCRAYIGR